VSLSSEERVRILATTCLDYLPGPKTWSGQLARSAHPKPVAEDVAPCTLCLGRGRVRSGQACLLCPSQIRPRHQSSDLIEHQCSECIVCSGSGWRKRRKGEEPHDRMTGLSRSELAVAADAPTPVRQHEGQRDDGDRLERARKARDRSGSYQEFERALDLLREGHSWYHHLVYHVLVCGEPINLMGHAQIALDAGVSWIAKEMKHHRVPAWAVNTADRDDARKTSLWRGKTVGHEKQRGVRNEEIRQAAANGEKKTAIARRYGITREHVHRIIRP